jgi:hypothetical protein
VDAESIRAGTRELLAVVGVAAAGLTLAALAAFTPWYAPADGSADVIEVHRPAVPAAESR